MRKPASQIPICLSLALCVTQLPPVPLYASSLVADNLVEEAIRYYESDDWEHAIHLLSKALAVDPDHELALEYIKRMGLNEGIYDPPRTQVSHIADLAKELQRKKTHLQDLEQDNLRRARLARLLEEDTLYLRDALKDREDENAGLREQIVGVEEAIQREQEKAQEIQRRQEEREQQIREMNGVMAQMRQELARRLMAIRSKEQDIGELQNMLQSAQRKSVEDAQDFQMHMHQLRREYTEFREETAKARTEQERYIEKLQDALRKRGMAVGGFKNKLLSTEYQLSQREKQLIEKSRQVISLSEQLAELEAQMAVLQEHAGPQPSAGPDSSLPPEVRRDIEQRQRWLKETDAQLARSRQTLEALEQDTRMQSQDSTARMRLLKQQMSTLNDLDDRIDRSRKELDEISSRKSDLRRAESAAQQTLDRQQQQIRQYERVISGLQSDVSIARQNLGRLEEELRRTRAGELPQGTPLIREQVRINQDMTQAIDAAHASLNGASSQDGAAFGDDAVIAGLERELVAARQDLEAMENSLIEDTADTLQRDELVAKQRRQIAELQRELRNAQQSSAGMDREMVSAFNERLPQIQHRIQEQDAVLDELRDKLAQAQKKLDRVNRIVAKHKTRSGGGTEQDAPGMDSSLFEDLEALENPSSVMTELHQELEDTRTELARLQARTAGGDSQDLIKENESLRRDLAELTEKKIPAIKEQLRKQGLVIDDLRSQLSKRKPDQRGRGLQPSSADEDVLADSAAVKELEAELKEARALLDKWQTSAGQAGKSTASAGEGRPATPEISARLNRKVSEALNVRLPKIEQRVAAQNKLIQQLQKDLAAAGVSLREQQKIADRQDAALSKMVPMSVVRDLERDLASTRRQLERLQRRPQRNNAGDQDIEQLRRQLDLLSEEKMDEIKKHVRRQNDVIADLNARLAEARQELNMMEASVDHQMDGKVGDVTAASARTRDVEAQLDDARQELKAMRERLAAATDGVAPAAGSDDMQAELVRLTQQYLPQIEQHMAAQNDVIRDLNRELAAARDALARQRREASRTTPTDMVPLADLEHARAELASVRHEMERLQMQTSSDASDAQEVQYLRGQLKIFAEEKFPEILERVRRQSETIEQLNQDLAEARGNLDVVEASVDQAMQANTAAAEKAAAELEAEIDAARAELQDLQNEPAGATARSGESEADYLRGEIARLTAQRLPRIEARVAQQSERIRALNKELAGAQQVLERQKAEIARLSSEATVPLSEFDRVTSELAATRQELQRLQQEPPEVVPVETADAQEVAFLRRQLRSLVEETLPGIKEHVQRQNVVIDQLNQELDAARAELQSMESSVDQAINGDAPRLTTTANATAVELEAELDAARAELAELQSQPVPAKAVKDKKDEADYLRAEIAKLTKERLPEIEKRIVEQNDIIRLLNRDLTVARKDLAKQKKMIASRSFPDFVPLEDFEKIESELAATRDELQRMKTAELSAAAVQAAGCESDALREQLKSLSTDKLPKIQEQIRRQNEVIAALRGQMDTTQKELTRMSDEVDDPELKESMAALASAEVPESQAYKELESEIDAAHNDIRRLANDRKDGKAAMTTAADRREANLLRKEIAELADKRLPRIEERVTKLNDTVRDLRGQLKKAQKALARHRPGQEPSMVAAEATGEGVLTNQQITELVNEKLPWIRQRVEEQNTTIRELTAQLTETKKALAAFQEGRISDEAVADLERAYLVKEQTDTITDLERQLSEALAEVDRLKQEERTVQNNIDAGKAAEDAGDQQDHVAELEYRLAEAKNRLSFLKEAPAWTLSVDRLMDLRNRMNAIKERLVTAMAEKGEDYQRLEARYMKTREHLREAEGILLQKQQQINVLEGQLDQILGGFSDEALGDLSAQ